MTYRTPVLALLALSVWLAPLPASSPLMDIDEVRPGMTGVGRTVFQGSETEEFRVEILGVLRNVMGPQRNLILARLEGGPLADTGVIQGMSGSPVYVDGRLIGAVSYSLGAFSKEPIAGITPIREMTESASLPARRPAGELARLELPITRDGLASVLRATYARMRPFASRPDEVQAFGLPSSAAQLGMQLRPIATPVIMGGFEADAVAVLSDALRDAGFVPILGGTGGGEPDGPAGPLRPGDAVGVSLIRGDLAMGGTGTVTHVDGDRVYAFGHPFFNLGPTEFPMTRAYVYSLLPSLMSSFKISSLGEVIGTMQQDRATAIAGTLGAGPPLVPVTVSLRPERGAESRFRFEVVNDQLLTPLLTYVSIFNTLTNYERQFGAATFTLQGRLRVKGHTDVSFEDLFTGDSPAIAAAAAVAGPVTFLMGNDLERVELDGIDLTIRSAEEPRTATIARVWLDEVRPRAGRTVPLKILMRTYRGEEVVQTVPIEIPPNAAGNLSILVSDGSHLAQWEQRELRRPLQPQSVAQMIRALNNARKNNRVYVRLLSSDAGAVVNGETLTALPPSVLAVFEGDRSGGNFIPLRNAAIGEWELTTPHAVRGSRLLGINVESR